MAVPALPVFLHRIKSVACQVGVGVKCSASKMSVVVKICGITSVVDALEVASAGADAVGLMFYEPSPRCLRMQVASEISAALPSSILRVGVFVNPAAGLVTEAVQTCRLNMLQFHGEESPEFCAQFGLTIIKAFRVSNAESLNLCRRYVTGTWLLDAFTPGTHGGTGARFDWDIAVAAHKLGNPFFLAGGLNPANVGEAIRKVHPYGVDVSSGVERAPGKKDPQKVRDFVRAAKEAAIATRLTG